MKQRSNPLFSVFAAGIGGVIVGAAIIGLTGAATQDAEVVDVLDVRRINVVNEDGSYALVLANSSELPGVIRDGEESGDREGIPGILFYNNLGDEIGGLIYPYRVTDRWGVDAGVSLSMDQPGHSQAVNLIHWRNGDFVRSALRVSDFPTDITAQEVRESEAYREAVAAVRDAEDEAKEAAYREYLRVMGENRFVAERIYLGSEGRKQRKAMLELKDSRSRPRIRLIVDEQDQPRIVVLDENGEVVQSLVDTGVD